MCVLRFHLHLCLFMLPLRPSPSFWRHLASMASKNPLEQLNVLSQPLAKHSTTSDPISGYMRDGFCAQTPSDRGKHLVAGFLSKQFLDFSRARGNDLRQVPGLDAGCRWCLCVDRWREAFDARGQEGEGVVPKVDLAATHVRHIEMTDRKAANRLIFYR